MDGEIIMGMDKILKAIAAVGCCLLAVSVFGIVMSVKGSKNNGSIDVVQNLTQMSDSAETTVQSVSSADTTVNSAGDAVNTTAANVQSGSSSSTAPKSDAEFLAFFNSSLNKIKTSAPGFTKAKQTKTSDIQLSNSLAQTYVSVAKDKYLSDDTVTTNVNKGDKAAAVKNVSPDGASFVSNLGAGDIKAIKHSTDSSGNYVIHIDMNDATNPDKNSAYGKILQFMTVDDVVNTYAPNMNATVDRSNISVAFSGCWAEATITPDGKVTAYSTYVGAHMLLKDAKISVIKTDLDVTLISSTKYTNFAW